jgi:hypothetical protein
MNLTNWVQTGGLPVKGERLQEMQTAYSIFNELGYLAGNLTIISGCIITGTSVSDGYVFIDGEVFKFKGGFISENVIIIQNESAKEFENGEVKAMHYERFATFGTADTSWAWDNFKRCFPTQNIPAALLLKTDLSIFNALTDAFAVVYAKLLTIEEGAQKNKDEYYQYGTVTTQNRAQGVLETDFSKNYADIYPPAGYTTANLKGFIPSIAKIAFNGDVNNDDTMWCQYSVDGTKIRVICNDSESRETSKINYLAIWKK